MRRTCTCARKLTIELTLNRCSTSACTVKCKYAQLRVHVCGVLDTQKPSTYSLTCLHEEYVTLCEVGVYVMLKSLFLLTVNNVKQSRNLGSTSIHCNYISDVNTSISVYFIVFNFERLKGSRVALYIEEYLGLGLDLNHRLR